MIKIRLSGESDSVKSFLSLLKDDKRMEILSVSNEYKNNNSVYVRQYVEVKEVSLGGGLK